MLFFLQRSSLPFTEIRYMCACWILRLQIVCIFMCVQVRINLVEQLTNGFPKMCNVKRWCRHCFHTRCLSNNTAFDLSISIQKKKNFSLKSSTVWKLCKAGVYTPYILLFGFTFLNSRVNKFLFLLTLHCELDMQLFNCWVDSKRIYITGNFEVCHIIRYDGHVENENKIQAGVC